jgi:hypothetical protein
MAKAEPSYWFGIVRSVSFPGVVMDVDRVFMHAEAKDADPAKRLAYLRPRVRHFPAIFRGFSQPIPCGT